MIKINKIGKTSILLVISLTCLMMAAASVNADTIRDPVIIDHDAINGEREDLIIAPAQEEPLIIAPAPISDETNDDQNSDLVISPQGVTINEDEENPESSLIAPRNQKTEENTVNIGLPAIAVIALIGGLLVSVLLFKRRE